MSRRSSSRKKRSKQRRRQAARQTPQHPSAARGDTRQSKHPYWERLSNAPMSHVLLIILVLVAYINAWPNNLVFDDAVFAASGRFADLDLMGVAHFFTEDLWIATGYASQLYRPLLLLSIAIDALIFGDWVAGYHLVSILLHLIATLLVYGFVRHLLLGSGENPAMAGYAALLAAIIFGVHPIHTEAVNSIFNRSEILVTIGIVGSLWWFLKTRELYPLKAWVGLTLVYLPILLVRESGVALPALAVCLLWITSPGNWRTQVGRALPVLMLLLPLGIYLILRANALDAPYEGAQPSIPSVPKLDEITELDEYGLRFDPSRFGPAVLVWFNALKIMVWPHPLMTYHEWIRLESWVSLVLNLAPQLVLLGIAIAKWLKGRPGLLTGLAFFYIAILPSSRILSEASHPPSLSERFLYFPSVGLAIILAFGLVWLVKRFNPAVATFSILTLAVILTPLTWARNTDWSTEVRLFESDYKKNPHEQQIQRGLINAHLIEENYSAAIALCERHNILETGKFNTNYKCGMAYAHSARIEMAERSFFRAMEIKPKFADSYFTLASLYTFLGRRTEARTYYDKAIEVERNPAYKAFRTGFKLIQLYPTDREKLLEARNQFETALALQPQLFLARQELALVNEQLESSTGRVEP
jgi:tetratricopeptide (TPR) repeat protein